MRNPHFVPPARVIVPPPRLNAIAATVGDFLIANAGRENIDDEEIIALAPEFSAVPGTLKAIKDRLGLS